MSLSAVLLTHNSATSLENSVKSLHFADEVIVLDDFSGDATPDLARRLPVLFLQHHVNGDFAAHRNFALKRARSDWVFFLDADERVSRPLAEEICRATQTSSSHVGYFISRLDHFLGRALLHGETGSLKLLRLAKKSAGSWHRPVHETWQVSGATGTLTHPLHHYPHSSLHVFFATLNAYTDLEAGYRSRPGRGKLYFQTLTYPVGKFLGNYFLKLGFLDGFPGLVMAFFMSLHSLIVRIKLYEKNTG